MGYVLNGQEEGEKQVALVIEEQIKCIYNTQLGKVQMEGT
jgi:hypothetical protein